MNFIIVSLMNFQLIMKGFNPTMKTKVVKILAYIYIYHVKGNARGVQLDILRVKCILYKYIV